MSAFLLGFLILSPPERVVSLAPSITEILLDLGARDRIVGVTVYDRDPALDGIPRVGGWVDPDLERLLALRPDMVLLTRAQVPFVGPKLERLGIPYRAVSATSLPDILASVDSLGRWLGLPHETKVLRERLESALREALRMRPQTPLPALFVVDRRPDQIADLYVAGKGTYLDSLLSLAGFRNVVQGRGFLPLGVEALLALRPQVILELSQSGEADPEAWKQLPEIPAVSRGWVFELDRDLFAHPSSRFPLALKRLLRLRLELRDGSGP